MIHYLTGDATDPRHRPAIIAHVVNDVGAWGSGFVLAVSRRWPEPERSYRAAWRNANLGDVQFVYCNDDIIVANMFAQRGLKSKQNPKPLRLEALTLCLHWLRAKAYLCNVPVSMPRIGCGLGGATWGEVEPVIEQALSGIDVYVYDLPGRNSMST